jgi:hypothetical protein
MLLSGRKTMNLSEYRKLAKRTESLPTFKVDPDDFEWDQTPIDFVAIEGYLIVRALHAAMGMASELHELSNAMHKIDVVNVGEELGDIMWYWALAVDSIPGGDDGISGQLDWIFRRHTSPGMGSYAGLTYAVSEYSDLIKKWAFYGRTPEDDSLRVILHQIAQEVLTIMRQFGLDPAEQLEKNINKLRVRYPDKFETHLANVRDLAAERKELEK